MNKEFVRPDLLLFFATSDEEKMLKKVAEEMSISFETKSAEKLGKYYDLGTVGDFRVNAVKIEMGSLSYGGSASRGIAYKIASGATSIVQVGMAFGTVPSRQSLGDVLVSSSIVPYDRRDIRADSRTKYVVDYSPAKRHPAKKSLLRIFLAARKRGTPYQVHVGAMLSGSARIHSGYFRDELVSSIPARDDEIIGGEMEGFGLLSISPRDDPVWIIVKGISDFADEHRDDVIEEARPKACYNAASFVLSALRDAHCV